VGAAPVLGLVILTLGALAGCSGDTVIALERPTIAGAESWVVALLGGDVPRFFAQDLDASEPLRFDAARDEALRVEAYVFDVPLAALGLTTGPLVRAPDGVGSARVLTTPLRIVRRDVDASSWTTLERADPELAEARFPRATPCRTLEVRTEVVPTSDQLRWALPVGADQALVGGEAGLLLWASRTEAPRVASQVPVMTAMAAVIDRRLHVELGGVRGAITQLDVSRPSPVGERSAPLPVPHRIVRMAGDVDDLRRELWVLTASGAVYQRRSGAWSERYQFSRDLAGDAVDGGLVWLSPDRVLVGYASEAFAVELDGDRRIERPVFQQSLGMLSMQRLADGSLVAGSFSGVLARSTDDGVVWDDLGRTPDGLNAYGFAGASSVFWYVGVLGTIGEYRDGVGYCPTAGVNVRGGSFASVVTVGDGMLAIGESPNEEPSWSWLDPR
jgi:hypothetical protein